MSRGGVFTDRTALSLRAEWNRGVSHAAARSLPGNTEVRGDLRTGWSRCGDQLSSTVSFQRTEVLLSTRCEVPSCTAAIELSDGLQT